MQAHAQLGKESLCPSNLFSFEKDEYGHHVLEFDGLDLTGEQEIARLAEAGYYLHDGVCALLTYRGEGCYDADHKLEAGASYRIALMPHAIIKSDLNRTAEALIKIAAVRFGYQRPLAGIAPRIRELVTNEMKRQMAFSYITVPHIPLIDGDSNAFSIDDCFDQNIFGVKPSGPNTIEGYWGASAFLIAD